MKNILLHILIILFLNNTYAQDYCAQAENLSINPSGSCNLTGIGLGDDLNDQDQIGEANITINTSCANPGGGWNTYWGQFTGNGNAVDIVVYNPSRDGVLVVFENTPCGGTMNEMTCFNFLQNVGGGITINTINGANYTIAIFRASGGSSMSADISIIDNPTGASYSPLCDVCSAYGNVPVLSVQSADVDCFNNPNVVVTDDATDMPPVPMGCTTNDSWYLSSFIATSTTTNFYLWGKEEDNLSLSILEGPCSNLTQLACEVSNDEDLPTSLQTNTVIGQEYFVLITTSSDMSSAQLCIYEEEAPAADLPFCLGGMSFEDGAGAGWDASHGSYHPTDISLSNYIWDDVNNGIPQPAKGEITTGNGYDPNVGIMVPIVAPGGGNNSFRLGSLGTAEGFGPVSIPGYSSNTNHAAAEVMSFCFTVDAANAGFGYKYAIVMDYSNHIPDKQPKMEVFIEDACTGGTLISCGQYEHFPNDGVSDFKFVGDVTDVSGQDDGVIFSFWNDVATDLTSYIGQDIRVTFRVRDCEGGTGTNSETVKGTHWAYAYIDTYCSPLNIVTPEFCAGSSSIDICAPSGFLSYDWPAGQTGMVGPLDQQCVTINNPVAGDSYTVNMTSVTGCIVTRVITLAQVPAILPPDTTVICSGDNATLQITPTGINTPYTYLWSNGNTSSTIVVSPTDTTTYSVDISNSLGCKSTYDFVVSVDPCSTLPIELAKFDGVNKGEENLLVWETLSENNNDYFTLERSVDGKNWAMVAKVNSEGNTTTGHYYTFKDRWFDKTVNYYRLKQTDFDGESETFHIISIDNKTVRVTLIKRYNLLGVEITDEYYTGTVIDLYSDGTTKRRYLIKGK